MGQRGKKKGQDGEKLDHITTYKKPQKTKKSSKNKGEGKEENGWCLIRAGGNLNKKMTLGRQKKVTSGKAMQPLPP